MTCCWPPPISPRPSRRSPPIPTSRLPPPLRRPPRPSVRTRQREIQPPTSTPAPPPLNQARTRTQLFSLSPRRGRIVRPTPAPRRSRAHPVRPFTMNHERQRIKTLGPHQGTHVAMAADQGILEGRQKPGVRAALHRGTSDQRGEGRHSDRTTG